MKKEVPIEMRLKKGFSEVYKLVNSLSLEPDNVSIERSFVKAEFNGATGFDSMVITRNTPDNIEPDPWMSDVENVKVSNQDLNRLREPKAIAKVVKNNDDLITITMAYGPAVKLQSYGLTKDWNPIADFVDAHEWVQSNLLGVFKKAEDFSRIDLDTGEQTPIGKFPGGKGRKIMTIGRKLYPKAFDSEDSISLFTYEEVNKNMLKVYGLFQNDKYISLVAYHNILKDI